MDNVIVTNNNFKADNKGLIEVQCNSCKGEFIEAYSYKDYKFCPYCGTSLLKRLKKSSDKILSNQIIELLNEHCKHGYVKTIDNKLYHCITGNELIKIIKGLFKLHSFDVGKKSSDNL